MTGRRVRQKRVIKGVALALALVILWTLVIIYLGGYVA